MKTPTALFAALIMTGIVFPQAVLAWNSYDHDRWPMLLADVPPPKWARPVVEDKRPPLDCSKKNEHKPECRDFINDLPRKGKPERTGEVRKPG
jgi:hypothetical protein